MISHIKLSTPDRRAFKLSKKDIMGTDSTPTPKTLEDYRKSLSHQQLGRGLCAAFVAWDRGIQMNTALRTTKQPVSDFWLQLAEVVLYRQTRLRSREDFGVAGCSETNDSMEQ